MYTRPYFVIMNNESHGHPIAKHHHNHEKLYPLLQSLPTSCSGHSKKHEVTTIDLVTLVQTLQ